MYSNQTSLQAYESIQHSLGERQAHILRTISVYPGKNNREISALSSLPINCVTPRVLELRRMGLIEPDEILVDKVTGRRAVTWRVKQHG